MSLLYNFETGLQYKSALLISTPIQRQTPDKQQLMPMYPR